MNACSLVRLFVLSAIWGGSFLLIRVGAPALGPVMLMEARVVLAALFLAGVGLLWRRPLLWRAHWRHYLILGLVNSALSAWGCWCRRPGPDESPNRLAEGECPKQESLRSRLAASDFAPASDF